MCFYFWDRFPVPCGDKTCRATYVECLQAMQELDYRQSALHAQHLIINSEKGYISSASKSALSPLQMLNGNFLTNNAASSELQLTYDKVGDYYYLPNTSLILFLVNILFWKLDSSLIVFLY